MKAKLYKENDGYSLFVDGKIFGDTDGHPLKAITNKLSLKNCQAIELGYDLDELAYDYSWNHQSDPKWGGTIDIFKAGFEKAEKDDTNCYTAFREEIGSLILKFKTK